MSNVSRQVSTLKHSSCPSLLAASLADVRKLLGHLPKKTRARDTWQHVETEMKKAAAGGDAAQVYVALQMVLQLENVEYQMKEAAN